MKFKLTSILACVALLFSAAVSQAQYASVTGLSSLTLAGSTTTNLATPVIIDCRYQQNMAIQFDLIQTGAGTSNAVFVLQPSGDGLTWDTNHIISITIAANGTNAITSCTNIASTGIGYYRLYSVTSPNTSAGTNFTLSTFKWFPKRNAH